MFTSRDRRWVGDVARVRVKRHKCTILMKLRQHLGDLGIYVRIGVILKETSNGQYLRVCGMNNIQLTHFKLQVHSVVNTLRTGLLNCLNARSRGLNFRHRASCI